MNSIVTDQEPAKSTQCEASSYPLAASGCARSALAPTEQEVALLTTQYHKALDGLYEAYKFGQMLLAVKARLESDPHGSPENQGFSRSAARGTAGRSFDEMHGWNAGTGLKGWLGVYCPEINYSTARRFLSVAEKTNAALALDSEQSTVDSGQGAFRDGSAGLSTVSASPDDCRLTTVDFPAEQAVRAYLAGKSQRQVLKAPSKPTPRHAMSEAERAEKLAEVCKGFLESLEGVERTGQSDLLRLEDRREIVTRLKALARRLEEAGR